jgi:uncharacterized protein YuzE
MVGFDAAWRDKKRRHARARALHQIYIVESNEYPTAQGDKMKCEYDASADAAYIMIGDGDSSRFGFTYACDPSEVDGLIHLDFDMDGRLIGVEVLQASRKLPRALLDACSFEKKGSI